MSYMRIMQRKKKEFMRKLIVSETQSKPTDKTDLDENDLRNMNEDLNAFIQRQIG